MRNIIMETALSPSPVRASLDQTRNDYDQMVGARSACLAETARNPDFVQFLLRNVARTELALASAKLRDDR